MLKKMFFAFIFASIVYSVSAQPPLPTFDSGDWGSDTIGQDPTNSEG